MEERDAFNLDDIFAEVDGVLKGNDAQIEPEVKVDRGERVDVYSKYFIHSIFPTVSKSTDPRGLAERMRREFESYKSQQIDHLNTNEEWELAEIVGGMELDDLVKAAGSYIDEAERGIVEFEPGSFDYRRQEEQIRKLEIIQMACEEAKGLE